GFKADALHAKLPGVVVVVPADLIRVHRAGDGFQQVDAARLTQHRIGGQGDGGEGSPDLAEGHRLVDLLGEERAVRRVEPVVRVVEPLGILRAVVQVVKKLVAHDSARLDAGVEQFYGVLEVRFTRDHDLHLVAAIITRPGNVEIFSHADVNRVVGDVVAKGEHLQRPGGLDKNRLAALGHEDLGKHVRDDGQGQAEDHHQHTGEVEDSPAAMGAVARWPACGGLAMMRYHLLLLRCDGNNTNKTTSGREPARKQVRVSAGSSDGAG